MSRAMKDSGIPWIGEIPDSWGIVRGKNLTSVFSGYPFDSNLFSLDARFMPLIRIRDILNNYSPTYYSGDYPQDAIVHFGDILIGMDGDFNVAYWVGEDGLLNQRVCKLLIKDIAFPKYVYYVIQNPLKAKNDITYSTTVKHLSVGDIGELSLPFPPINEQIIIADLLDKKCGEIDEMISLQEKIIEELKAYKQSVITEAVCKGLNPNVPMKDSGIKWIGAIPWRWNIVQTRRIVHSHLQGYYDADGYVASGYRLLRITDLSTNGNIILTDAPYVKETPQIGAFLLKQGDFCFARTGGAGSFGYVSGDIEPAVFASYLIRFRFIGQNTNYLRYYFLSHSFISEVGSLIHGGVNKNIHADNIKDTHIVLPPLEEQQAIADYLDEKCCEIDSLISVKQSKIDALKEYKKSIIYEYITGKKVING